MNRPLRAIALFGAIAASLPAACTAQQPAAPVANLPVPTTAPPAVSMVGGLPDFTNLVQQVGPAVVNISAEVGSRRTASRQQMPEDTQITEFFRRFFVDDMPFPGGPMQPGPRAPQGPRGVSQGTGFLISDDGYVLTNHHVIDGADTVNVRLSDRREFKARVVGSDEQSDVALLKIEGKGLPALRTSTATLKPGQWVVAIGSPFGLDHSVTAGIVSAVGRANPYANQQYVPFIQTDVAINRGNSGGPLLNTKGEVVGINSQIFSNSGGYMGVSFAIPIDLAIGVVNQLKTSGKVSRGLLGVNIQNLDAGLAKGAGLSDTLGALVTAVQPGGAADKAGVQVGDVIRAVNGQNIKLSSDLPPLVGRLPAGSKVRLSVFREGRTVELDVVLDELTAAAEGTGPMPGTPGNAPAAPTAGNPLGIVSQDLAAPERQRLGLQAGEGVRIVRITGDAAAEAGLQPGDVILSVGRRSVGSSSALNRELASVKPGETVMLLVRRGAGTQFIAVTAEAG